MSHNFGTFRTHSKSLPQKLGFAALHLLLVLFSIWLILFDGISALPGDLTLSDPNRALILLVCMILYFGRHLVTLFYLLQRTVPWAEVLGLIGFFAIIELGLLSLGGGIWHETPIPLGGLDILACILVLYGSYLNSFSEIQRKWWKADATNKGHCYTLGLFSYAMHINFFGDIVLFTGWALFSHSLWALCLPLLMTGMFIFMHIPGLDAYLLDRYGDEFRVYARKTKKLIPWVY